MSKKDFARSPEQIWAEMQDLHKRRHDIVTDRAQQDLYLAMVDREIYLWRELAEADTAAGPWWTYAAESMRLHLTVHRFNMAGDSR